MVDETEERDEERGGSLRSISSSGITTSVDGPAEGERVTERRRDCSLRLGLTCGPRRADEPERGADERDPYEYIFGLSGGVAGVIDGVAEEVDPGLGGQPT